MTDKRHPFPLVADGEPVIIPDRPMQLYETEDLITRIRGEYRDKLYQDPYFELPKAAQNRRDAFYTATPPLNHKRETSKARELARKDIKQKRQVFVDNDMTATGLMAKKSLKPVTKSVTNELSRFGKHLEQESYILAELPTLYTQPQSSTNRQVQKNNFDFLKKSQIYNKEAYHSQKERQVAQELNLTRFEDSEG